MLHYIISFIVYTCAMIGILLGAFVVYKKTMLGRPFQKNSSLKIEDMLNLPDKNVLYVINCRGEEYLIGSSNGGVRMLSKLGETKKCAENEPISPYKNPAEEIARGSAIKSLLKELSDKKQKRGEY